MATNERALFGKTALDRAISQISEFTNTPEVYARRISQHPYAFIRLLVATMTLRQTANRNQSARPNPRFNHAIARLKRIPMAAAVRVAGFNIMQMLMKYIIFCYEAGYYAMPDADVDYASRYVSFWANKFIRQGWRSEYAALNYYSIMVFLWSYMADSERSAADIIRIVITGVQADTRGRVAAIAA